MHAYQGGGGVKKPQKYAYVICESPLTYEVDYVYLHVIYLVPYIDFLSDRQVLSLVIFHGGRKMES